MRLDLCSIVQRMGNQRLLLQFIHPLEQHSALSVGDLSCFKRLGNPVSSLVHELGHTPFLKRELL